MEVARGAMAVSWTLPSGQSSASQVNEATSVELVDTRLLAEGLLRAGYRCESDLRVGKGLRGPLK